MSLRSLAMTIASTLWLCAGQGCSPTPASIEVGPENLRLTNELKSSQLSAVVKDKAGKTLQGQPVAYKSMTPTIAMVSAGGKVEAVRSGIATVLVSAGEVKKEISISVQLAKKIVIDPDSPHLMLGVSRGFKATVFNDQNKPMLAGQVRWTSSDPAIFTVDARGNIKTLTEGTATLNAHAAGIVGKTVVTVKHERLREDGSLR